jgi:hypothetical protein
MGCWEVVRYALVMSDVGKGCIEADGFPLDTSAAAHALQRDLYRRLGGRERLAISFRLNETVRQLAMAGIRARHPEYDDDQVRQAHIRLVLGDRLVRAVWPDRELVVP